MSYTYFPLYITVFVIALIVTVFAEKMLIPILKGHAKQPIYETGPSWHMSKSGTPTMGGLAFLIATIFTLFIAAFFLIYTDRRNEAISLIITLSFATANALIGVLDDVTKLIKKENAGLTPVQKLFLQFLFAVAFLFLRGRLLNDGTAIYFSFGKIDLGLLYYPLAIIMLLGITNCANLTDGVDGLASSVAFSIGIVLFYISASSFTEVALIASALIGCCLGFLFFNIHPAKIFMGDTGSLFLGSLTVGCAFSLRNPLIMIFIGGVYVIEGVSVILQVIYYKATRKRLFKMAPLHHHFEKCGMSENKICVFAIIVTLLLSIPAFILFNP